MLRDRLAEVADYNVPAVFSESVSQPSLSLADVQDSVVTMTANSIDDMRAGAGELRQDVEGSGGACHGVSFLDMSASVAAVAATRNSSNRFRSPGAWKCRSHQEVLDVFVSPVSNEWRLGEHISCRMMIIDDSPIPADDVTNGRGPRMISENHHRSG